MSVSGFRKSVRKKIYLCLPKAIVFSSLLSIIALLSQLDLGCLSPITNNFLVDTLCNFIPFFFFSCLILGLISLRFRLWGLSILALNVALANAVVISPYITVGAEATINYNNKSTFSIVSANVLRPNNSFKGAIKSIISSNPNCFGLIEMNSEWERAALSLAKSYPDKLVDARNKNGYGLGLFCKKGLIDKAQLLQTAPRQPQIIKASINWKDELIDVWLVHTLSPANVYRWRKRNEQLKSLARLAKKEVRPVILIGDLNITMWSRDFRNLIKKGNLIDARLGKGIVPTWNLIPLLSFIPLIPIDHALISKDFRHSNLNSIYLPGSDHAAIKLDVQL
jgi:endonuclease/exonuclease/phosphatase (EEP) superfamily protein YafD